MPKGYVYICGLEQIIRRAHVIECIESVIDTQIIFSLHFLAGYCANFTAKTVI
jgi:hypothetical protein